MEEMNATISDLQLQVEEWVANCDLLRAELQQIQEEDELKDQFAKQSLGVERRAEEITMKELEKQVSIVSEKEMVNTKRRPVKIGLKERK